MAPNKKKKKITPNGTHVAAKHSKSKKNAKKVTPEQNQNCLLFIPPGNNITPNITPALNQPIYLIANPGPVTSAKPKKINLGKFIFNYIKTFSWMIVVQHPEKLYNKFQSK